MHCGEMGGYRLDTPLGSLYQNGVGIGMNNRLCCEGVRSQSMQVVLATGRVSTKGPGRKNTSWVFCCLNLPGLYGKVMDERDLC